MSSSYADGLSPYENKGVLGLEEVKKNVRRDGIFSFFFFFRRRAVNAMAFYPPRRRFLAESSDALFFFFSSFFPFFISFCLQRYDSVETLRLKCGLLAEWIQGARHVVVHTGAGISTAAGIPDFR